MKFNSLNPSIFSNRCGNRRLRLALIALLCASVVFGCAQIRKVTYPRNFVYLEHKQLRNKMALLSFYLRRLNETMLEHSIAGSDPQQDILVLLNKIDGLTVELGGTVTTNHLVIDDHIDEFKIDVKRAIHEASANPPNYYMAGRLTGSCTGCHKFRD